ncbi:hypothetical protein SDC9_09141 [bioreactor metagenome]|uniref:Uncharacterized protein n=1 Tax=bioreactor metagenome TaxID=1076179 RepID=A0A644T980_9ZZZZ
MDFLFGLIVLVILIAAGVWLFVTRQGDAEFDFLVDQRTGFSLVEMTDKIAVFSCRVPFVNKGTQDGTIMDAYTRHLLPHEQYDSAEVSSRLELESAPRTDGYFEALIVPKTTGETVVVTVTLTAKEGNVQAALAQMVDMPIDIVYQIVARGEWYITKNRLVMKANEIIKAAGLKRAV